MASNPDDIAADAVDLELEAMKKDDYTWHPCQVHFSPDDAGLVIRYENDDSQDTLMSEKEAMMRIRVRSLPLQGDDCTRIKPGEHVVVNRNSQSEGGFFDAEVEKVLKVRHSKRAQCRCTFMIRWLHQDINGGSLTVPSSSVMRLANKSINDHPAISEFIDTVLLNDSCFSDMSPELNVLNEIDLDLHDLLEKQIEGIRNSVHGPKKKVRDEILGLEANTIEQVEGINISMPDVREPEIQVSADKSRSRRSNRSRKEVLQRVDVKDTTSSVIPNPSSEKKLSDNRSPLNPLAARAALASLMSKLPQSVEISLNEEEGNALKSLDQAHYSSSGINSFLTVNKLSSETEVDPKPVKVVKKSLFSTNDSSQMSQVFEVSNTLLRQDTVNPEIGTRSTRAKVKKANGISDDNIEKSSCIDGNKSSTATNRRLTRSRLCKEGESITTETTTRSEEHITSDHKAKADGKKTLPVDGIDSVSNARRKILPKKEEGNKGIDIEGKILTVDTKNSSNTRRHTRSMINKEAANIKTETSKESGGDESPRNKVINLPFCTDIDLSPAEGSKKRVLSGGTKTSEKTDTKFSDASVDQLPTEQRNKKRNTSRVSSATQDSEGNVRSDGECSNGCKKNSFDLKKHKVRSSPRFLPKT